MKRSCARGIATAARCWRSDSSDASRQVLDRLHWPESHIVPALVKPLTRRAMRLPHLPMAFNRLISAVTHPLVQIVARSRPLRAECEPIRRFDHAFTALWERLAPKFDLVGAARFRRI